MTRMGKSRVLFAFLLLVGVPLALLAIRRHRDPEPYVLAAREALGRRNPNAALSAARQALSRRGDLAAALFLAGDAEAALGNSQVALEYFAQIPDSAWPDAREARLAAGDLLVSQLKRLSEAEEQFRRAAKIDPRHPPTQAWLAYVLGVGSQWWEMIPHRLRTIAEGQATPQQLYLIAQGEDGLESEETLAAFHASLPSDPGPITGLARWAEQRQQHARALDLARQAVRLRPSFVAGQLTLGELLLAHGTSDAFEEWLTELGAPVQTHPTYWKLRGQSEFNLGNRDGALRCFWEACRIDPTQMSANAHLARLLLERNEPERAAVFQQRAVDLQKQYTAAKVAYTSIRASDCRAAAVASEAIGLFWEAYGWRRLSLARSPDSPEDAAHADRLRHMLEGMPSERTSPEFNLARKLDFTHLPLPEPRLQKRGDFGRPADMITITPPRPSTDVTFRDDSQTSGIRFVYFNGHDPGRATHRMYEFTGGGVAALDYDLDGHPDLYFTQGCRWPHVPGQREHLDQLFRNRGDATFDEVTEFSGITEDVFSQGVAAGDVNEDGFPDLYVANLGSNRLFLNHGDGTWSNSALNESVAGGDWSTSVAIADLDGDGCSDIYIVNYLSGGDLFERTCGSPGPRSCSPHHFAAAQDQLLRSDGKGGFVDDTERSGIVLPDGKGLGIVAADFFNSGRLDLFVANDAVPNFFFRNHAPQRGDGSRNTEWRFTEQALSLGVALNAEGRAEACMGIACGDADGDGLLDLFVTNFFDEPNTFYRQQPGGMFLDDTRSAGLREPSLRMLGFGTQFLDGELDGALDLVLVNGHVDDLRQQGIPWKMRAQYFTNRGDGKFAEIPAATVGEFFSRERLGRGLARLDWNCDGLEDFAVSYLDAPASLVTNTTRHHGGFLALRLVGMQGSRDAIGTAVVATVGTRKIVRQLTAGDGYMASNERQLIFGLGDADRVDEILVRWPGGAEQVFRDLPPNSHWVLIEGKEKPIRFTIGE